MDVQIAGEAAREMDKLRNAARTCLPPGSERA